MPIYEYQCTECGFETEVLQKISDDPITHCDKCGKETMKKKISAAGFRLKGGGWYETDFKSGSKKNIHSADDKKATQSGGSKSSSKSE